jgi:hypothetical protein
MIHPVVAQFGFPCLIHTAALAPVIKDPVSTSFQPFQPFALLISLKIATENR